MSSQGERTYHSFYQLCRGCPSSQKKELKLPSDPGAFRYIGTSAKVAVPTVDDVAWWANTCHAMGVFGLTEEQQQGVRLVLAAVLHIGNLAFATLKIERQVRATA